MGEITVAEYEAVLPFGISNMIPSNMKHSNPFTILLNVLENIWQRQYDVTYESIQKSRLYILDGSSYIKQIPKRPRLCPVCEFTTANHRDSAANNCLSK
jgi:hypothetical protein